MIDQPTPPFRAGDVAYTARAPGDYASAAAVPADPAYGDSVPRTVAAIVIPIGTSAGTAAAIVAARINSSQHLSAAVTSNQVRVGTKAPNVLNTLGCTIT